MRTLFVFLYLANAIHFTDACAASKVQMNDVSILFPLATTQLDYNAYIKADDIGLGGVLVPQNIFTAFNIPGQTAVGQGGSELVYSNLRLVALRLDPCFANIGPIVNPSSCQNQLRLVFQALNFSNGITSAEDTGLHVFYSLTRDQLLDAVNEIVALRTSINGTSDLGSLAIHPMIEKEGVAGKMGIGLAQLVKKYAGSANLTRMTRMYSSSDFWDFNGIDIVNGTATNMVIPTIPSNGTVVSFTEPVSLGGFGGTFLPSSTSPDNIETLAFSFKATVASPQARQDSLSAMLRIENPNFHSPNTIDCASCHISEVARIINSSLFGLSSQNNPFAFVAPNSIPSADLALTEPVIPGQSNKNFHAFSYRGTQARINQRVVNETALIVDYLNR